MFEGCYRLVRYNNKKVCCYPAQVFLLAVSFVFNVGDSSFLNDALVGASLILLSLRCYHECGYALSIIF